MRISFWAIHSPSQYHPSIRHLRYVRAADAAPRAAHARGRPNRWRVAAGVSMTLAHFCSINTETGDEMVINHWISKGFCLPTAPGHTRPQIDGR
jgi:hypothetical protein